MKKLKFILSRIRHGKVTAEVIGTAGDNIPAEVLYYNRFGIICGFWAYGSFDPKLPYRGEQA